MNGISIDPTQLFAIWMDGVVLMIPLLALAIRFALVPLIDSLTRLRAAAARPELEERLSTLQANLLRLTEAVVRLSEASARRAA